MADPENWVDPLNGYAYDSFNPDALMMMSVKNGRVVLPGGARYKILVIPGVMKMNLNAQLSAMVTQKIIQLVKEGATVLIDSVYKKAFLFNGSGLQFKQQKNIAIAVAGKGRFILTPYWGSDFSAIGLQKDMLIDTFPTMKWQDKKLPKKLAVHHRRVGEKEIYLISNQNDQYQTFDFSFNAVGLLPEIYDPVTGTISKPFSADIKKGRISFLESFEPFESKFIIFNKKGIPVPHDQSKDVNYVKQVQPVSNDWELVFKTADDSVTRIVKSYELESWTADSADFIKYFSGTVLYKSSFTIVKKIDSLETAFVRMRFLYNLATIKVNGINCGTIWTKPYQANILKAIRQGENQIEIEVTNTWHNRLIGDNYLPAAKRATFTTAPFRLSGKPLEPAGIVGSVEIFTTFYK